MIYGKGTGETKPLGIILIIASQFFAGTMFIIEEKLLGDYYLDPLKVVGFEGLWGLIYYAILLPIFQQIKCNVDGLCTNGRLEDTAQAFSQMGQEPVLIAYSICIIFSIACFNGFGVAVTKNASSAQRSTIDTSRTVLIWVFCLIYPGAGVHEEFHFLQLGGFIVLVIGTLVYNEIIVIPFLGLDQNTRAALAQKEAEGKALLDGKHGHMGNNDYMAVSPQAPYDANRNKRKLN